MPHLEGLGLEVRQERGAVEQNKLAPLHHAVIARVLQPCGAAPGPESSQ